ncbi:unnamed protein product [Symbiodinium necroappetens]|uniref:Uncharacterized protein n=1 Tax=Symbiodinium necroappetens TaxID=1628268 RepID=A0A812IT15_9DINO|nr:unnamed protein product [Symbiodinium necroappetens]
MWLLPPPCGSMPESTLRLRPVQGGLDRSMRAYRAFSQAPWLDKILDLQDLLLQTFSPAEPSGKILPEVAVNRQQQIESEQAIARFSQTCHATRVAPSRTELEEVWTVYSRRPGDEEDLARHCDITVQTQLKLPACDCLKDLPSSMLRFLSVFAVLVVASGQTAQDDKVLADAAETVEKYCSVIESLPELDTDAAREDLEGGAGADNFIVTLIEEAGIARQNGDNVAQIADRFQEIADPGFVAGKAFAVVLSILLFVLWVLCCWFVCCPCCCKMCCRCCQRKWATGKVFKGVLWLLFIAFGVAAVIMVSTSMSGATNIDNGISGTACSAAVLIQDAVAGSPEHDFTGLLPAHNTLSGLATILNPGSSFLTQLNTIIDQTQDIQKAVDLAAGTMEALQMMMENPVNVNPVVDPNNPSSSTMYHKCQVCEPLAEILGRINDVFASSTGEAMAQLRGKIEENLQGSAAEDLRVSITQAMEPIKAAKDAFVEQVGFFVEPGSGGFQQSTEMVAGENSMLQPAVLAFFAFYLLIALSALIALSLWSAKDNQGEKPDICCVRFCSGCVSCSACIYAMIVLLIAGIMVIVAMFGSGLCLVMIDFDQESGANLMAAVGADVPPEVEMALKIADRCFSLKHPEQDPGFSRNLADIVDIPPMNQTRADLGESSTIHEEIFTFALDPIMQQIDNAQASLGGDGSAPSLANDAATQELLSMIGALDMSALYLPVESEIAAASSPYKAMMEDVQGSTSPFKAYLVNSVSCPNVSLSDALGDLGGQSVPGIEAMATDGFTVQGNAVPGLSYYMDTPMAGSCPSLTGGTCNNNLTMQFFEPGCTAAASFLKDIKQKFQTEELFMCTYIVNGPNDPTPCYPRNMVQSGGSWTGTCLNGGTVYRRTRKCTLAEFNDFVKGAEQDIQKSFEYFDAITSSLLDAIINDMKTLVQTDIITPVVDLLDMLNCGFMRNFWQGLTDNMCYRGMNGFRLIANSYVISGLLSLCIALLIIIPWKISRDNADRALLADQPAEVVQRTV